MGTASTTFDEYAMEYGTSYAELFRPEPQWEEGISPWELPKTREPNVWKGGKVKRKKNGKTMV